MRARLALEIGGSAAVASDAADPSEREPVLGYLECRVRPIAAGTNQMQRNGVSERILGLPREPSFDTTEPFSEVVRQSRAWSGKVG